MLKKYLDNISKIDKNNEALIFIIKRFNSNKYRGLQLFQHNRFDDDKMYKILECIKSVFLEKKLSYIKIPRGDENNGKNNGFLKEEFPEYSLIVKKIQNAGLGGTPNTLKKNYFPDWDRSGIIKRDKKKSIFHLNEFIIKNDIEKWREKELYKFHINALLPKNFIGNIYNLLKKLKNIEYYEFLLFISYMNCFSNIDNLNLDEENEIDYIEKLILSWRKLSKINKQSAIENLKKFMDPNQYKKLTKNNKKDWGNLNNETQQIFQHLKDSKLFLITKENEKYKEISLQVDNNNSNNNFKRNRDLYNEYHRFNKTKKELGYEMDHIFRFSLITTPDDIPYIENILNLIYIDAKSHAEKSQTGSNHIILKKYDEISLILEDYRNIHDPIILKLDSNIKINKSNIDRYINHNKKLLDKYNFLK